MTCQGTGFPLIIKLLTALKSNRLFLVSVFLFFHCYLQAQVNPEFVKHLSKNGLQREHNFLLESFSEENQTDSILYFKAKYHLEHRNDSLFLLNFFKSKALVMDDTNAFNLAGVQLLTARPALQKSFFQGIPIENANFTIQQLNRAFQAGLDPMSFETWDFPEELQQDFSLYRKAYQKKPMVAGALSLAVPGLGKLYAGRTNSFVASLFSQTVYGIASYESIRKLGPVHPFSILSVGFFSVFYVSNIYGSFNAVKQAKKDYQKQFILNASHYYHIHHTGSLY
jgi:hypothetical protein